METPLEIFNKLSEEKRALLLLRLKEKFRERNQKKIIPRRNGQDPAPLSFAQQRIWFLWHLQPDSSAYNSGLAARLTGPLDVAALEQSLNEIVRRHEILRTIFPVIEGAPAQVVLPHRLVKIPVTDLGHLAGAEREAQARRLVDEEIQRPFDLINDPALRVRFLSLDEHDRVLILNMHHIIIDGWSMGVLMREVKALYDAFSKGLPSPLPDLPIQYADYAVWQREWLQGAVLEEQSEYWVKQLAGPLPVIDLPTDRLRLAVQGARGGIELFEPSVDLSEGLKRLCRSEQVTLYICLLAAFQTLLHRYTGQDTIVVGTSNANRNLEQVEELIGFFVNTLVIRTDVSGNPTFRELLRRVRAVAIEAAEHQDMPFDKLVEVLSPERNLDRMPLFQVMFDFHNWQEEALELSDIKVEGIAGTHTTSKFDLTLVISESDQKIRCSLEYNSDLFNADTIRLMLSHFEMLLGGVVADPDRRVGALPLLSPRQRRYLLSEWNDSSADFPRHSPLPLLFRSQAALSPHAPALLCGDESLSYAELDSRSDQLAHHLLHLGVSRGSRVGVLLEHSFDTLVALLGVLKAGAAYVPLDPLHPPARLRFAVADSGAALLLTHSRLRRLRPELPADTRVLCLDADRQAIARQRTTPCPCPPTADDLAYVIYTSGSTGVPKGVAVAHRSLVNYLWWARATYLRGDRLNFALYSSLAFDLTVTSLFTPLISGSAVVIFPADQATALSQILSDGRVGALKLTPSHLALLLSQAPGRAAGLRRLIVGGEALLTELARQAARAFGAGVELYNEYGPTEATVGCMAYRYEAGRDERVGVPIGRPAANTEIYVLDGGLRPAGINLRGEVYIGGEGVARGYWGRAGLTAERFVPDPLSREGGRRLYRSGDEARVLASGEVEYLGRGDGQVKVRGHRVELGEVREAALRHPEVRDAVVRVERDGGGREAVVCYYVARREVEAGELRRAVCEYVYAEAAPRVWVHLRKLPLTLNGKVNYDGLPKWEDAQARRRQHRRYVAPRNDVEQTLAEIWSAVLGITRISIEDNFFELGGDSILSIRIIAKANQAGIKLAPNHLFKYQTIALLAEASDKVSADTPTQEPVTGAVLLTPIQHWFFEQELSAPHHYNQAVMFETRRPLDTTILGEAVCRLPKHHDALRLRFIRHETGWQQISSAEDGSAVFVKIDLSDVPEEEQGRAIEARAAQLQTTLDLSQGPLMRVAHFDLGPAAPARLLMIVHHLVVDAVSWWIILEDLQTVYAQLSEGQAVELPAKTTSFREWAERLHAYAQSEELRRESSYWLAESRRGVRPLPLDYANQPNAKDSVGAVTARLGREETRMLLQETHAFYNLRVNDLLLTAVAKAFREWTGQSSLLLDLEGHGREEVLEGVDVTRTVGWFTTIYPVLLQLPETDDIGEDLKSIKEQLREVPQRGIGYGLLRYLSDDRQLSEELRRSPRAEASFNYLGQLDQVLSESSPFIPARESVGPVYGPEGERPHLLDISGSVAEGQLQLTWSYSRNLHHPTTIERLAETCLDSLRALIAHACGSEATAYTPSDFPEAGLGQAELDDLLSRFAETERNNVEDIYPLTPMQEGMLFHSVYAPQSVSYFVQMAYTVRGPLDLPTLKRAWQKVIEVNGVLRTSFAWERLHAPLQIVHRKVGAAWEQQDWRGLSANEQDGRLKEFLQADKQRGFDLSRPPLMRIAVMRVDDDACHITFSHHHLVLDGWSMPLVIKELFRNYDALRQGHEVALKPARPYKDYIAWLKRQDITRAELFWRQALKGFTTPSHLSNNGNRRAAPASHGDFAARPLKLSAATTSALRSLSQQHRLTMNTLVQGAWALLLSHLSGADDVVYGAAVSGRPATLAEVDSMVGLFINTLPVRVRIREQETLLRWLGRLQAELIEVYQYAYTPLVKIHGWSEAPRGLPLFDSHVSFDNYPFEAPLGESNGGFEIALVEAVDWNDFPLSLAVGVGDELTALIKYDRQSFDAASIERMASHFVNLLEHFAGGLGAELSGLKELLAEAERRERSAERSDFREQSRRKLKSIVPKPVSAPAHTEEKDHERA